MSITRLPSKKTKIICTIGPASSSQEVLAQMMVNGMNVARINFAHGDFATHRKTIANVRAAAEETGKRVAIFGDLPGPKMRIGALEEEPIELERGQPFVLQAEEIIGNRERVSLDFPGLPEVVNPGDHIYVNDGYVQLRVEGVQGREVHTIVEVGGELRSNKGVNFPGIDLGISAFTEEDHEYLAFAAEQKLDGVSQSFVLGPQDISAVREAAAKLNYEPFVIAKIERAGALERIGDILKVADAIMVARGDLGVEIPIEEIPAVQKHLIRLANVASRPVITATQMLESMTAYRRPTRAEATDVANAILDGTDCVMLSGETAVGSFPIETVSVMTRIAQQTEVKMENGAVAAILQAQEEAGEIDRKDLLSLTVFLMAETLDPANLFVPSRSGGTARRLSRFRLGQWLVAPSQFDKTCQQLQFSYGVFPVLTEEGLISEPYLRRRWAADWLHDYGLEEGMVFLVESAGTLKAEDTKRIDIIALGDD